MKKANTKNTRINYFTITLIPTVCTIILYILYISTESKVEKLLLLFIFILVLIPFTMQLLFRILNMMLSGTVKDNVKEYKKVNKGNSELIKPNSDSGAKNYKSKENNNENYISLRQSIKDHSKNGNLKRADILSFKNELDYRLGNNRYNYSGFNFENDMHEIYIKIKSSKLTDEDYLYLQGVLEDLAG